MPAAWWRHWGWEKDSEPSLMQLVDHGQDKQSNNCSDKKHEQCANGSL